VSEAYTRAVNEPAKPAESSGGCCTPTAPKGVAAKLAGYSTQELQTIPSDAASNAFGCGNPTAFMHVQEGQVVLDLGAGAGIDLLLAAAKVGPSGKVIGVDMTDAMIERARANVEKAGVTNVDVRKGIIEALPVEDSSVDWVISNCVINLSPDKPRVFAEINRVLRPGGRMVVSDIVADELPGWVRESAELYGSCIAGAISEADYLGGLEAAGLVDLEVRGRLVYDEAQLRAFAGSEITEASCCSKTIGKETAERVVEALRDKVASVRVVGRKA
jgi:SAM-dependent methyltransferase